LDITRRGRGAGQNGVHVLEPETLPHRIDPQNTFYPVIGLRASALCRASSLSFSAIPSSSSTPTISAPLVNALGYISGRNPGGKSYGYNLVHKLLENGQIDRGERTVNEEGRQFRHGQVSPLIKKKILEPNNRTNSNSIWNLLAPYHKARSNFYSIIWRSKFLDEGIDFADALIDGFLFFVQNCHFFFQQIDQFFLPAATGGHRFASIAFLRQKKGWANAKDT
jgi:hypothetical protein